MILCPYCHDGPTMVDGRVGHCYCERLVNWYHGDVLVWRLGLRSSRPSEAYVFVIGESVFKMTDSEWCRYHFLTLSLGDSPGSFGMLGPPAVESVPEGEREGFVDHIVEMILATDVLES